MKQALWGGHVVVAEKEYDGGMYRIEVAEGVKGFNVPVEAVVIDGVWHVWHHGKPLTVVEATKLVPEQEVVQTNVAVLVIEHCTKCPNHAIEPDPDQEDWFNDDDVKIRCTASPATYRGNIANEPYVTVACRPYNTEKEDQVPSWCPILKK